ncbi:hypothetical protein GPECTOR_1g673 [Gonium pectorale]|uniref:Uncharacterized protein n=1 Tax=Gonium pectorale TaxID=33097 RepID=A0A150H3J9_GONPE|nr:hypothetical protein GPECTOR_1g673 [Gonium pectorale]|eukprot:KXZ56747.1 hypothetical protein GPECTOR_1g673 [Gonium pectorale]
MMAGPLSESMALRITSGGVLFALGSVIILMVILGRQMPGRRSMATSAMLLGSSSWALLRWLTGHWLPSAYSLLHNRWLLGYLAVSGLVGSAMTYLYGGVEHPKINTLMRVGLQLLGVLLMYTGMWTLPAVFASLLGLVVGLKVVRGVTPFVSRLSRAPARQIAGAAEAGAEEHLPATPLGLAPGASQRIAEPYHLAVNGGGGASPLPLTPVNTHQLKPVAAYVSEPGGCTVGQGVVDMVSPLVRAGLIINPLSGRSIKIGGEVYDRLVEQGFTPDVTTGRLQPPLVTPGSAGSPEGATPGSRSAARRRTQRSRI